MTNDEIKLKKILSIQDGKITGLELVAVRVSVLKMLLVLIGVTVGAMFAVILMMFWRL